MNAYHNRFAQALRAALPEGFEVLADRSLCSVFYGSAALSGFIPSVADKRQPVQAEDVSDWIARNVSRLRSQMYHYTPQAKEAAAAMLAALTPEEVPA